MKKILFLLLSFIFILSSCSPEPAAVQRCFTANVSAKCSFAELRGELSVAENDVLTLKITSPESLKGFTYKYKNGKLKISLENLNIRSEKAYLPDNALPSVLYNVISSIGRKDNCTLAGADGEVATYAGKSDSGEYKLTADFKTGRIKKIIVEELSFTAKFN